MRHGPRAALMTLWLVLILPAAGQTLDDRVREIARELMCPVCEGQTVAESSSELAAQMRALIKERLAQGQTRDEILTYFVSRYGESILAVPPRRGLGLVAWVGPLLVLVLALALAARTLRRWTRPQTSDTGP